MFHLSFILQEKIQVSADLLEKNVLYYFSKAEFKIMSNMLPSLRNDRDIQKQPPEVF